MTFYSDTLNTIVCAIIALQLIANLAVMPRLNAHDNPNTSRLDDSRQLDNKLVSILIPARNEAPVIAQCLRSILNQTHTQLEILVLNDNSTDDTAAIVKSIGDERIQLINGAPLPDGWSGKNWACHQLTQRATADVFLFIDADTTLEPSAVSSTLTTLESHNAGLVSALTASSYQSRSDVA
jgi:chlorobactene glucosyltransferase